MDTELRQIKTAMDEFFRLEYMLFRSREPMTQEATECAAQLYHEARRKCMRLCGLPETD